MSTAKASSVPAAGVSSILESSLWLQALLLCGWGAFWMGAQSFMLAQGLGSKGQVGCLLMGLLLVFGGTFLAARAPFLRLLTSTSFAVVQIFFLGLAVATGALLPQEVLPPGSPGGDGAFFGSWNQALHLGDVHHSLWFLALLAVLSLSMLAVAWKRGPYSLARAGFLLVHIAPTFALMGALWSQFAGVKARVELKAGQGTYTFQRTQGPPYVLPGFQVRLERFEARPRPSGFRLAVASRKGGLGASVTDSRALSLVEGQKGKLPGGLEFEVERLVPDALDFRIEAGEMPLAPAFSPDPDLLLVVLGVGGPEPLLGLLQAFGEERFRKDEPLGRFAVLFRERLDPNLLAALRPHQPRAERLVATFQGQILGVPAKAGERLEVGGSNLRVMATYPDFQVRKDVAGNPVMSSRSAEPRDPWLDVELTPPGKAPRRVLLSARQPDYTDHLNAPNLPEGLSLRYLREGEEWQRRFVVFSNAERRVALVEAGIVMKEGTWDLNRPFVVAPGLSVTAVGLFDRYYSTPANLAMAPGIAAVRLKVTDPLTATSERAWLRSDGQPQAFFGGRVTLEGLRLPSDPRRLHSTLLVTDPQGRELARKVVGVNDPLVYDGLSFLQSPHPARDPEASALLVVDQPGAWIAWLGFVLLLMGIPWMFYLKPWLKRRTEEVAR